MNMDLVGLMDIILGPLLRVIIMAVDLYVWIITISIVFSWLNAFGIVNTSNRFVYMIGEFLFRSTEPILRRIRVFMPDLGNFDISPLVLIFALIFAKDILIRVMMRFA